ncbi:MAG: histidine--tRNA ligase [Oscillospiraceae bacterium]|nr:histidine--tRNA ligase [Oscillospiraceae bacterium]
MELITKRPKGTQDVKPADVYKWHTVEQIAAETAECYGFKEIRFPTFENTKLFKRSVGDSTDVVQKEMYGVTAKSSANGKDDDDFTLRPEGTAGAARAVLENGMLSDALPQKVYYNISCFRHEKPQAGRLREFHQFGAEMYGSASPAADAEMIAMVDAFLRRLGIKEIALNINSIGCPKCRGEYHKALKSYFEGRKDELCGTCQERLEKNPMRILDCKSPICQGIAKDAPVILDYLCDDCKSHFEKLQKNLTAMNIEFTVNPKIVRGLDYYTKTVFEFVTTSIGAQGTVCGGGRYDGLIEQLGGAPTPALGFAMGIERLIMTMESQGCDFIEPKKCALYIAAMDDTAMEKAIVLTKMLRDDGIWAEYDLAGRGLKAQMKYANKLGADFSMVLGSNEIESGKANLKNMETGEQTEISLGDSFLDDFSNISVANMFSGVLNDIDI